jgi:hypothetical protein
MTRFRVAPDRSVVAIEARSSVGPILWQAEGAQGWVDAHIEGDIVDVSNQPSAHLELPVRNLRSGNTLYDAELMRRIDARRFPTTVVELREALALGDPARYEVRGEVTFHGVRRALHGTVAATLDAGRVLRVEGDQIFDIRDFNVPSPTILMLKIFPDVRVRLRLEADPEDKESG